MARSFALVARIVLPTLAVALLAGCAVAGPPKPPAHPARVQVEVSPDTIGAGETAAVTVRLAPIDGIKINKYPRTKLVVGDSSLVGDAETSVGNDTPPPPDEMSTNYFDGAVEPLRLELRVADGAAAGRHSVDAELTYFYCMPASGFCAPKRETVSIPLSVR